MTYPYSWEERKPLFHREIFFVPDYYFDHHLFSFPDFSSPEIFGNSLPVSLEFCSGHGHWITDKALQHPEKNWIAVEWQFERARRIWSKKQNQQIKNLLIVCGEALTFAHHYLKEGSLSEVYINFPDPWPKTKHASHRLMQRPFIDQLHRILQPGGKLLFVSDYLPYCQQTAKTVIESSHFDPAYPYPHYITTWDEYGYSYFEKLWKEEGRTIHYLQFANCPAAVFSQST